MHGSKTHRDLRESEIKKRRSIVPGIINLSNHQEPHEQAKDLSRITRNAIKNEDRLHQAILILSVL